MATIHAIAKDLRTFAYYVAAEGTDASALAAARFRAAADAAGGEDEWTQVEASPRLAEWFSQTTAGRHGIVVIDR